MATWNILHGIDFRRSSVDLAAVAAHLAVLDADVVALQEVDAFQPRTGEVAQADELARTLGYRSVFAASLWGDTTTAWTATRGPLAASHEWPAYGIALLSRLPVKRVRRLRLSGGGAHRRRRPPNPARPGWDYEPRVALQAQIEVGTTVVHVAATHLSYMPWRSIRQLRTVLAAQEGLEPAVILGDLNLPPRVVNAAAKGWVPAGGEPTYPAPGPRMQLDQILVRGLGVTSLRVGPEECSDHRSVVAELRVP